MAKAEAYSEKHGRNISLDEAHQLYFSQTGKKERFVFRCGDSLCRSKLNPLVSAALYDRSDIPGEMSYTPYFRSLNNHPHIEKCTWLELIKSINNSSKTKNASLTSWSISQKGLILTPFHPRKSLQALLNQKPVKALFRVSGLNLLGSCWSLQKDIWRILSINVTP